MTRTSSTLSRQPGIVEQSSLRHNSGRQIDWANVAESRRESAETVKINGAKAAGVTSLTVDALPIALARDTFLKFGTYAPVNVTLNDASVTAGDTSITVAALSGPLPVGAVLNFTGGTNAEVAIVATAAAAGATTIAVEALDGTITNTKVAAWPGGTIGARVTADAAAGATTLTVDETQFPIADDAEATYGGTGKKAIKALTVMAQLSSGKLIPRADVTGAEVSTCIIESAAAEDDTSVSGYGCLTGGALYENLLPDASSGSISSTYKTELVAAGCSFAFEQYGDNTTS
jgi:hypothetical protein